MKNITIVYIFTIVFYLQAGFKENINEINFTDAIKKYRHYIIEKANDTLLHLSEYHKENYLACLMDTIDENISLERKKCILNNIAYIGRVLSAKKNLNINRKISFYSDYIEDDKIYHLCILAIKEPNLKRNAIDILLKHSRKDLLNKYSKEIKRYIKENWKSSSVDGEVDKKIKRFHYDELYMLLPLSEKEKSELLNRLEKKYIPQQYLARLGDKEAEKSLIERFKKASHYQAEGNSESKAHLAYLLGIAGTSNCAKALIEGLNSPIADKRKDGNYRSIKIPIIKALGMIHPEEPFLRIDINFIEYKGDRAYGGEERIKKYLDKVIKWAADTYNLKITRNSFKPVLSRPLPLVRPSSSKE